MSKDRMKIPPFEQLWAESQNRGASLEDLAREFYDYLVQPDRDTGKEVTLLLNLIAEIQGLINWLSDDKISPDSNEWQIVKELLQNFKQHKHVEGEVVIPIIKK